MVALDFNRCYKAFYEQWAKSSSGQFPCTTLADMMVQLSRKALGFQPGLCQLGQPGVQFQGLLVVRVRYHSQADTDSQASSEGDGRENMAQADVSASASKIFGVLGR